MTEEGRTLAKATADQLKTVLPTKTEIFVLPPKTDENAEEREALAKAVAKQKRETSVRDRCDRVETRMHEEYARLLNIWKKSAKKADEEGQERPKPPAKPSEKKSKAARRDNLRAAAHRDKQITEGRKRRSEAEAEIIHKKEEET